MGLIHTIHMAPEELLGLVPMGEAGEPGEETAGGGAGYNPPGGAAPSTPDYGGFFSQLTTSITDLGSQVGELGSQVATLSESQAPAAEPAAPAAAPSWAVNPSYPGGVVPKESDQPGAGYVKVGTPAHYASEAGQVSHTAATKPIKKTVHK